MVYQESIQGACLSATKHSDLSVALGNFDSFNSTSRVQLIFTSIPSLTESPLHD